MSVAAMLRQLPVRLQDWPEYLIIARIWKANLRPTLPWLHTLRWALWLIGMLTLTFAVVRTGGMRFSLFAFGMAPEQRLRWLRNCRGLGEAAICSRIAAARVSRRLVA
jgi:hypothetical protein